MDPRGILEAGTVLADGGIETAIVYGTDYPLPELQTIGMLDDPAGRTVLAKLWTAYLGVAHHHRLPAIIGTPTWRGGTDRIAAAGRPPGDMARLNGAGVEFQRALVDSLGMATSVWVAGVLGPRRDGYDPTEAPGAEEAADYHADQAAALGDADLLFAVPLPSAEEAVGICRAMAVTGTPYVPSFLVDATGRLPDTTPLGAVVERIDAEVRPTPLYCSVSCVHPAVVVEGAPGGGWDRVKELKANGSALPPAALDRLTELACDPPGVWAEAMLIARDALGLAVVGGCCGTDPSHLEALAVRLTS